MKRYQSIDKTIFNVLGSVIITFFSLVCFLPFILILSSSFTSEAIIKMEGYQIFPKEFSFHAYTTIFGDTSDVVKAYGMTLYATSVGALLGLFITSMAAFILSRRDFKWRNGFSFFFYFTTLFNGGLVPWYIVCVQYLKFKQFPLLALVLPYLVSVFNLIIMKTFMRDIPDAIYESAKVDGAGQFRIFAQLILPLSKPVLACVGLFIALGYWNDWFLTYIFVDNKSYFSLQYYLYRTVVSAQTIQKIATVTGIDSTRVPTESAKMAMTIIATGPMFLLYPSLQKYFVKGLTIGAVKG